MMRQSSSVVPACLRLLSLPLYSKTAAARMVTESIDEAGLVQPPPSTSAYNVLVSGTAKGIIHNAKRMVIVE